MSSTSTPHHTTCTGHRARPWSTLACAGSTIEYQVLERLSFQRFLSLRRSNRIPEHTTFWTFRERLTVMKARDTLCFEVVNRRPSRLYGPVMGRSWMPVNWKLVRRRRKDTAAIRPQKHGKSTFGHKLSVSVDRRYKLIRKLKASTARENDSLHLEDVLDHVNTARDPYGDNGYVDCGHEHRLKAQG